MLRHRYIGLLLIFFSIISFNIKAQVFSFPKPNHTKFIDKKVTKADGEADTVYRYESKLSKKEVLDFYRNVFSRQGLKEKDFTGTNSDYEKPSIIFSKDEFGFIAVILGHYARGETLYYRIFSNKKEKLIEFKKSLRDKSYNIKFAPAYPKAKIYYFNDTKHPAVSVKYLASGLINSIANFYLEKMPEFGWKLAKRKSYRDKCSLSEIIGCDLCAEDNKRLPKIRASRVSLIFKQEGKVCNILITKANKLIKTLDSLNIDSTSFKKFGNISIGVIYNEKE
ncbi:MAG: hypothetical protein NG712_05255 [Omnitrophica bacterium]|nr:hypothetical protein [Candidatus Omnitrophota bacterium]